MNTTGAQSGQVVSKIGRKTFVVERGLKVCLLSDSICRGVEDHINNIQAFVHPGTNLSRSLGQHVWHFDKITGSMLVLINIGSNDIASGIRPQDLVDKMLALINRIQDGHQEPMYFAVCAVLPRPLDDLQKKNVVKECNALLEHCFESWENVAFLRTNSVFLSRGQIVQQLYGRDGLHLNMQGKQKLFGYINRFLWHFCRHK
nr:uncharacterized protein LOC129450958 [Misgurnus anguillicaudatus]